MSLRPSSEHAGMLDLPSFFDRSADMTCIRDLQGRLVRVNRVWEKSLGYAPDELQGASLVQLIHPEDASMTRSRMRHVDLDGDIIGFVNRYRRRDGGYRHLEWQARRIGDVVFGVARDVTQRLAMEAQVAAAEKVRLNLFAAISRETGKPLADVIALAAAFGRTALTPAQRDMLRVIARSSEMLEGLISHAFEACRINAERRQLQMCAPRRPL